MFLTLGMRAVRTLESSLLRDSLQPDEFETGLTGLGSEFGFFWS